MNIDETKILEIIEAAAEGLITVPELLGFSAESADQMYGAALALFERGAFARAESVLEWLVGAKPYVARYWTAYAGTLQAREALIEAIRCYTIAIALDPDDIVARANRGECCLLVGLVERGLEDLDYVARRSDAEAKFQPWVTRAKRLRALHEEASALACA